MKRKYKRLMAAVAGAAVLSSAILPGLPAIKVHAAQNRVSTDNPSTVAQDGGATSQAGDPVQVVRDNAATLGLDRTSEGVSLLSSTGTQATVQVRDGGQTFKVDLYQKAGRWVITTVRGNGDKQHSVTYMRSGLLRFRRAAQSPVAVVRQQMLYQSNSFAGWQWHENSYPLDMVLGVLLVDPRLGGGASAPDNPLNPINEVDFSSQFVLYAHLGTVAQQGYGIGIAGVVQTGNDLIVTVNTKSPQPNDVWKASKVDDFVILDRNTLDFSRAIKITFVSADGSVLSSYTVSPS